MQIINTEGKEKFKREFKFISKMENFSNVNIIGIILDGDNSVENTFNSICDVINNCNYHPPKKLNEFSNNNPKIGIYVMPNNKENGMLEDLCLKTVENNPLINCVNDCINCANKLYENDKVYNYFNEIEYFNNKKFINKKISNIAKTKAQIYLALMPKICNSVGVGANKSYWNINSEHLNNLKRFLENFK